MLLALLASLEPASSIRLNLVQGYMAICLRATSSGARTEHLGPLVPQTVLSASPDWSMWALQPDPTWQEYSDHLFNCSVSV